MIAEKLLKDYTDSDIYEMRQVLMDMDMTQQRPYSNAELQMMYKENKRSFCQVDNVPDYICDLYSRYIRKKFTIDWNFVMFQRYFFCR